MSPVVLCGVALLALNDHWLKGAFPGFVTGKLSDFAGLAFFPLLLQAAIEGAQAMVRRYAGPSRKVLLAACLATAVCFALVKLGVADGIYAVAWGGLQWPFRALAAWARGAAPPPFAPVRIVADPSDLLALPALALAWLAGVRRLG